MFTCDECKLACIPKTIDFGSGELPTGETRHHYIVLSTCCEAYVTTSTGLRASPEDVKDYYDYFYADGR